MPDLLTITLNPALDLSAETDAAVVAGPKLRLDAPLVEPGGGGINVARAVRALGGQARAVVALGGWTGARIRTLLEAEGVPLTIFDLPEESRQSLAVTERAGGAQYRFVMPGPAWTAAQVDALVARLEDEIRGLGPDPVIVLSGSQPPGFAADFPQDLARRLAGVRLVVDTSGPALEQLVRAPRPEAVPHVLRMDQAESEASAGRVLETPSDSLDFAQSLVQRGVALHVVLARGAEGSVLAGAGTRLFCAAPRVPVVSKVGAGDSFVAGLALALARGEDAGAALRAGTAAAAAAVMTPGTELCRGADAARLIADCAIRDDL